jgi:hypothetical protein
MRLTIRHNTRRAHRMAKPLATQSDSVVLELCLSNRTAPENLWSSRLLGDYVAVVGFNFTTPNQGGLYLSGNLVDCGASYSDSEGCG